MTHLSTTHDNSCCACASRVKREGIKVQEGWINNICSENTDEWHEFLRDPKANTGCPSDESQETLSETQEILSKNSPSDVNRNLTQQDGCKTQDGRMMYKNVAQDREYTVSRHIFLSFCRPESSSRPVA